MERRAFLKTALVAGVAGAQNLAVAHSAESDSGAPAPALPHVGDPGMLRGEMLYRTLGSTGELVSAIGLGGSHIAKPALTEDQTIRLIHAAIDRGITFMDNSWDYNQGESELRMGKALAQQGYRDKVFLMTKLDGRDKEIATSQLDESLKRLKTDHIDLIQHHEVIRYDDPDRIFAEGGAMEAVLEAKRAGKVRFIGFTGHKDPRIHLYMLEVAQKHGFHFDTLQMPLNVMDAHFRSFAQLVVPRALEQQVGVLGMKALGGADGIILKSGVITALECLHYALNLPTSVVITGIDNDKVLDQAVEAARTFKPMAEREVAALLSKTAAAAASGHYELFKTSAHFDTTARHPDWLGGDSPRVRSLAPQTAG
jgi:uncharacterized protein